MMGFFVFVFVMVFFNSRGKIHSGKQCENISLQQSDKQFKEVHSNRERHRCDAYSRVLEQEYQA